MPSKVFPISIGSGSTAASIEASLENFIKSLSPRLQKMTAKQLESYMRPFVDRAFKEVVRKWKGLLTRRGIDSSWKKPNGEAHIYDALVNGPMKVKPAGRYRKIIEWEILTAVNHMVFALEGFGDVGTSEVTSWGRQASLAAWANNKFGWNIPISSAGIVDKAQAENVDVMFAGRKTTAWGAIIALSKAVNDNNIRSYRLKEALGNYITTAIFSDAGLIGAFLKLASDFDDA